MLMHSFILFVYLNSNWFEFVWKRRKEKKKGTQPSVPAFPQRGPIRSGEIYGRHHELLRGWEVTPGDKQLRLSALAPWMAQHTEVLTSLWHWTCEFLSSETPSGIHDQQHWKSGLSDCHLHSSFTYSVQSSDFLAQPEPSALHHLWSQDRRAASHQSDPNREESCTFCHTMPLGVTLVAWFWFGSQ